MKKKALRAKGVSNREQAEKAIYGKGFDIAIEQQYDPLGRFGGDACVIHVSSPVFTDLVSHLLGWTMESVHQLTRFRIKNDLAMSLKELRKKLGPIRYQHS